METITELKKWIKKLEEELHFLHSEDYCVVCGSLKSKSGFCLDRDCPIDTVMKDWSLKDKGGFLSGYNDDGYFNHSVYMTEDVETLREKLIEDLENIRGDLFSGRNWKLIMKQRINKRFGVE